MAVRLDHLVIGARDLEAGRAWGLERLGVPPAGGGRHAAMGTHNLLWGLGDSYLEVIAIDPGGAPPSRPRWFGLDDPETQARIAAGPALLTWAVATDDLAPPAPVALSAPMAFARDDLTWEAALAEGAALPLDGAWPLLIRWKTGVHPAARLGDQGLALAALEIAGAGAAATATALGPVAGPVRFMPADGPTRLAARLSTPGGPVSL